MVSANVRTFTGELSLRPVFLGAGVGRLAEVLEEVSRVGAAAATSSCNFFSRSSDHSFNRTLSASLIS